MAVDLSQETAALREIRRVQADHLKALVRGLGDDALLALVLVCIAAGDNGLDNLRSVVIKEWDARKGSAATDGILNAVWQ